MTIACNEDVLVEIFVLLPTKSLIRFKLVCKRWFSIISDCHFSRRHTQHHRFLPSPEPSIILRLEETSCYFHLQSSISGKKLVQYHFSPTVIEPSNIICSFSKGLFLLRCRDIENPLEDCHIYNSTSKQSRKISLNTTNDKYTCIEGLNLAFDPLISPHYQIICVRSTKPGRLCQIEVYNSESRNWKLCEKLYYAMDDVDFNRGIYWNGGIHWNQIYFDLSDNLLWKHPPIVVPGDNDVDNLFSEYIESRGSLHYVAHLKREKAVFVFELPRNYSHWMLKYYINLDDAGCGPVSVLNVIRGVCEEDGILVVHEPGKVTGYKCREKSVEEPVDVANECREKSVEELIDFKEESFYREHCIQIFSQFTYQFVETLAPV